MNLEIFNIIILFLASLTLLFLSFRVSLFVLLILSVFLHKEMFSMYRWDVLPVRIFMLAITVYGLIRCIIWLFRNMKNRENIKINVKDPFIILMFLLWVTRGISLFFSANIEASISLFGFFTTVFVLGLLIYQNLKRNPNETLKLIKTYIFIVFGLCVFGFIQYFIYIKTGRIYGALWNVPDNLPRIGSLFWDVNHFGGLISALLPVLGALIFVSDSLKKKIVYLVILFPIMTILIMTNSRSAWISIVISFLVFMTLLLIKKVGFKGIPIVLLILFLLSVPLVREYNIKSSPFRAMIKQYFHYRIDSFDSHLLLINGAFEIFSKYPYFGGGYGSFYEQFSKTSVSATYFARDPAALNTRVPAHTIWGELVAETGIAGTAVYIPLLGVLLGTLLYAFNKAKNYKEYFLTGAMLSALIGWLVAGIFYSYNVEFFWIVFFLYFIYGKAVLGGDFSYSHMIEKFTRTKKFQISVLFALALFLLFINLGKNHFIPWDEAIYANIARNMIESKDYFVMNWIPGKVWFEKPPLYMWLISLSMSMVGYSELAARLPSAIFGLLTILLIYLMGSKLFSKTAGFISALSVLTSIHFLYYARTSMLDITTTFFITLSLYFYFRTREKNLICNMVFSGIAFGLAVMTKGVIGFIPAIVIFLFEIYSYLAKEQKLSKQRLLGYLSFILSGGLIFIPWHALMYQKFGFPFIKNYFLYHVVDRATTAIEDKGRPFFWYLTVMKVSMRLWFVVLLGAFPYAIHKVIKKDRVCSQKYIFVVLWFLVIFLIFSVSKSKLIWYIIPIYPAAGLLIGGFADALLNYLIEKAKFVKSKDILKFLLLYFVLIFSVFYLFLNKEKVYTSDLTGPQAILLKEKDRIYGVSKTVYVDRIELPLALYYTNGPFEIVDYGPLKRKIESVEYDQDLIFITKESRFKNFSKMNPNVRFVDQKNEWVLGYLESQSSVDIKAHAVRLRR